MFETPVLGTRSAVLLTYGPFVTPAFNQCLTNVQQYLWVVPCLKCLNKFHLKDGIISRKKRGTKWHQLIMKGLVNFESDLTWNHFFNLNVEKYVKSVACHFRVIGSRLKSLSFNFRIFYLAIIFKKVTVKCPSLSLSLSLTHTHTLPLPLFQYAQLFHTRRLYMHPESFFLSLFSITHKHTHTNVHILFCFMFLAFLSIFFTTLRHPEHINYGWQKKLTSLKFFGFHGPCTSVPFPKCFRKPTICFLQY